MRRFQPLASPLVAVAMGLLFVPPAHARGLDVSAPVYESPGGAVPVIVTAYGLPTGYRAEITARGTAGAVASCRGPVWINRRRATASRKCYLRLPGRRGTYDVVGRAKLTRKGHPTIVRVGRGSRSIEADGYRSGKPMPMRRIEEIERCFNDTKHVWLTFDDGGSSAQVRQILSTLRRNHVRGRFFFTGAWASGNEALMRRIRRAGHLVGNHSFGHVALSRVSGATVASEIARGTRATTMPKLLRPPFAAGALTTRLESIAAARGYRLCRWTVDSFDWHGDTGARMAERVRYGDALTPPIAAGGNVLMHGGGRHTAGGLQQIIDGVRAKRLTLDPLR